MATDALAFLTLGTAKRDEPADAAIGSPGDRTNVTATVNRSAGPVCCNGSILIMASVREAHMK
jgi:hypothetical protein